MASTGNSAWFLSCFPSSIESAIVVPSSFSYSSSSNNAPSSLQTFYSEIVSSIYLLFTKNLILYFKFVISKIFFKIIDILSLTVERARFIHRTILSNFDPNSVIPRICLFRNSFNIFVKSPFFLLFAIHLIENPVL